MPANSYDEVPYDSKPFLQTHPDRLATLATLFGLAPPNPARCRVLELGCASCGNLIPMAVTMPESTFVGIDLSSRQIGDGEATIRALELKNITLRQCSILDVGPEMGQFDYVICHGVFSWVPREVQEKILEIASRRLSENGVAYISYNTFPGWHMHGMIRDILYYHSSHFPDPRTRIAQARTLLDFLARNTPQEQNPYGMLLKQVVEDLRSRGDSYLFHEHLEEVNDPIYFHQFMERAAKQGLQYLSEADLLAMLPIRLPEEATELLRTLAGDTIHFQQYLDFLKNTRFRQSLLCHEGLRVDRGRYPERVFNLLVATPARPVSTLPDLRKNVSEVFEMPGGSLTTSAPLVKAAMTHLAERWPRAVSFEELLKTAQAQVRRAGAANVSDENADRLSLASSLLNGYVSTTLIRLHAWQPEFVTKPSERPLASPYSRLQAATNANVTTLTHAIVGLHKLHQHLLRYLDGTRDRSALVDALLAEAGDGRLRIQREDRVLYETEEQRAAIQETLEDGLGQLARNALLIA
jgi:methyltransferase-like protein/SAM-dependent methyltransferase